MNNRNRSAAKTRSESGPILVIVCLLFPAIIVIVVVVVELLIADFVIDLFPPTLVAT